MQAGGTTRLVISGAELGPETQLVFPFPNATVKVLEGSKPNQLSVDVTLPAEVSSGLYRTRVVSKTGISAPVTLGVDRFKQTAYASTVEELPIAMTGNLTGANLLESTFSGKAGQRIVIDVEAARIGSKLRPVVRLLDSRGVQIAWSASLSTIQGDARCEAVLTADGKYTVQLHDALYKGPGPGYFRMKIGDFQYADLTFPLAITRGAKTPLDLVSSSFKGKALALDPLKAFSPIGHVSIPGTSSSGARPRVIVSDFPELIETRAKPNEPQTLTAAPVAVSGKLETQNERDEYLIPVTPEKKYRVEVLAQRLGSSLDGIIEVHKAAGGGLGSNDDQAKTSDPGMDVTVPKGVNQIKLILRDIQGRYGPGYIYRIVVRPLSVPRFTVSTATALHSIPQGSQSTIQVSIARQGYNGAVKLSIPELPAGISLQGDEIPAGATSSLLTITAAKDAAPFVVSQLVASAKIGDQIVNRLVKIGAETSAWDTPEQSEIALAVNQQPKLTAAGSIQEANSTVQLGTKVVVPISIERNAGLKGEVRLSLITTQNPIKKQVPDPKDKKKKITVDDLDRMLRLEKAVTIAAGAKQATAVVLIPKDLTDIAWDLAFKAELLSADKKTVVASATTAATRVRLNSPLHLQLTGPTVLHFTGKLSRSTGFKQPATITVQGLPKGVTASTVELAADKSEFTLEIKLPATVDRSLLSKAQVIATTKVNNQEIKSQVLPLKLQ
ncbi:MAG: hypothetical protein COA78_08875 [Blastopirellula sp.]|nr:MAG: hypothetical protein COA78_08875 [Blastopirellula sp.]